MQTTDLFLGLIAKNGINTSETLPRKADLFLTGDSTFKQVFAKAVDKPAQAFKAPAGETTVKQPAAKETPRQDAPTSNAAEMQQQAAAARPEAEKSAERKEAYSSCADADQAKAREAKPAEAAKAPEAPAADGKAAAETTDKPVEKLELVAKLEALIDKLEQEADELDSSDEAALAELIVSLLAMLLQEEQAEGVENTGSSDMAVRLNLDPESALAKLLDVLMADKEMLADAALEDVKVLLKLSDEKGLLIPLSELVRYEGDSQEGDAAKFTIQFAEAKSGETVSLDLAISAEDVKAAQIVNLAQSPLSESDLVMTIPLEKLAQASGLDNIEALAAKLQQQGADNGKLGKLLSALGLSEKELAETIAAKEASAGKLEVAAPISLNQSDNATRPMIATAETLYIQTDEALKSMEAESLAKELTGLGKDRKELFDRLYKLMSELETKQDNFSKTLISKSGGSFFVKDWLENFGGQTKQDAQQWTSGIFRDTLAEKASFGETPNAVAAPTERIDFLGRSANSDNLNNQIQNSKAETAQQSSTRENDVNEMVMRQIIQRVSLNLVNGTQGEIRVFLRPDTLGDMTLKVSVDKDVILAKITAQSHEVKAIVESNLDQLKQALHEQGVKVGKFEVTVDTGSGNAQNGAQDQTGDNYLSQYASGQYDDGLEAAGGLPEIFDGDYAYSRAGYTPGSVSKHSYLA